MNKTITFTPFARVEGDLKIELRIEDGHVAEAFTSGTLYRGFEDILRGRIPTDAIVITCRICGQCGASHSAAASAALAKIYGVKSPPNGVLCTNVIQAVAIVLGHLAHFYLAFAPDLAGPPYDPALTERFVSIKGSAFREAIAARSRLLALLGLFAGKWPNTLAIQPGGVTKPVDMAEIARAGGVLAEFTRFLEEKVFGCRLDEWLALRRFADIERWLSNDRHAASDIGVFIRASMKAGLAELGRGPGRFLSGGGLDAHDGSEPYFQSGWWDGGLHKLDESLIAEHITSSWYEADDDEVQPSLGGARAKPSKEGAYSWCKAPRYGSKSAEVGPLARMVINGEPLALDILKAFGNCVLARVLMRLHEMAKLTAHLGEWLGYIDPAEPFYIHHEERDGSAFALAPAPRGMLGHWLTVKDGKVARYEIITPTGWNLSPRDSSGAPGPAEEALVGTPARDGAQSKSIAHVVRSFDPCLFCSVH